MNEREFLESIKVLNDSTRLSILKIIYSAHTICACKILDELKISQGTLSHHMKVLTENGFVSCVRDGKWCHYTLNKEKINQIISFLKEIC